MFIYMIAESSYMWSLKIYQRASLILFYLVWAMKNFSEIVVLLNGFKFT